MRNGALYWTNILLQKNTDNHNEFLIDKTLEIVSRMENSVVSDITRSHESSRDKLGKQDSIYTTAALIKVTYTVNHCEVNSALHLNLQSMSSELEQTYNKTLLVVAKSRIMYKKKAYHPVLLLL